MTDTGRKNSRWFPHRRHLLTLMGLLFALALIGQTPKGAFGVSPVSPADSALVTRAVVIGISEYQNDQIPDLQFAHVDAGVFARFLLTPAGGSVPKENIRLLLNEEATQGKIAAALSWLMAETGQNEQAIIYFSGHGDMESQTLMQHGFLLAHDAPPTTYMGGGTLPVFFLQSVIQTLSSNKKARVIMISDACRAGKLAGSEINGSQATAQMLSDQFANEIKVLSCQPNEYSLEGRQWGGGRGLFSYYLVDGMAGMADQNEDREVTLMELSRYLQDHVLAEAQPNSQVPMAIGPLFTVLTRVDETQLLTLEEERGILDEDLIALETKGLASAPEKGRDSLVREQYQQFRRALEEKHLLYPEQGSAYQLYLALRNNSGAKDLRANMERDLAAALQDEAQSAINDYLTAPATELKRRWSDDPSYEHYPEYLARSAELQGPGHQQYGDLKARQFYFEGLNLRLKGEKERRDSLLFHQAMARQKEALDWQPNAAFAYNEIGILNRRLGRYELAIPYFDTALMLSPKWPLPLNNISISLLQLGQTDEALIWARKAIKAAPGLFLSHYNLGTILERKGDYPAAVEAFEKALTIEATDAYTVFNLAYCRSKDGQFEAAAKGFRDYLRLEPRDPSAYNNLGKCLWELGRLGEAAEQFRFSLVLDPDQASANFQLGSLLLEMGEPEKALPYFETCSKAKALSPEGRLLHAKCLFKLGKTSEARQIIQVLTETDKDLKERVTNDPELKGLLEN